jgi:hypothetical protein
MKPIKPVIREVMIWGIVGARWWLRAHNLCYGPKAIVKHLRQEYPELLCPSVRTIARIIAVNDPPDVNTGRYDK